MKIPLLFIALLCFVMSYSQSYQTSNTSNYIMPTELKVKKDTMYYTDARFWKAANKSHYMRILSSYENGVQVEEQRNIKKGRLYLRKIYKGDEPVGVWQKLTKQGVELRNYNFEVHYSRTNCNRLKGKDPLRLLVHDLPSLNYKKPTIIVKGYEKTFNQYFRRNFDPPKHWYVKSLKGGLQIHVSTTFTITDTGTIENVVVTKGQSIEIDKEIVRTLSNMTFSTPPMLNGKPISVCVRYPVRIHIRPNAL